MADFSTLARPYARAAFMQAREQDTLDAWQLFLAVCASIIYNDDYKTLLSDPRVNSEHKVKVLLLTYESLAPSLGAISSYVTEQDRMLLKRAGIGNTPEEFMNFLTVLARAERLVLLPEIAKGFGALLQKERKQVDAYVVSARPLTNEQRQALQKRLAGVTQSIVILHDHVDPSLIGGATIHVGDKFIDGSVRGKLARLTAHLTA